MSNISNVNDFVQHFINKYGNNSSSHQVIMEKALQHFFKNKTLSEGKLINQQNLIKQQSNIRNLKPKNLEPINLGDVKHRSQGSYTGNDKFNMMKNTTEPNVQQLQNQKNLKSQRSQEDLRIFNSINQEAVKTQGLETKLYNRLQPFKQLKNQISSSDSEEEDKKSVYIIDGDQKEDEWAAIVKFDTQMYQKNLQQEKELKRQRKLQMKQELDKQVELKDKKKQEEKQEETNYFQFQQTLLQNLNEEEQQKLKTQHDKLQSLQNDRIIQQKLHNKKLTTEKKMEKTEKRALKSQYELDFEHEIKENNKKKQFEREYLFRVMKESQDMKEVLKKKEQDLIKQDQEQFKLYGNILDILEQKRISEIKARNEKIAKAGNPPKDTRIFYKTQQIIQQEEERNAYFEKLAQQKRIEEEQQKQELKLKQKEELVKILEEQVASRRKQKDQEKQINQAQAKFWKEDAEKYFDQEDTKKQQIAKTNKRHQEILVNQINERQQQKPSDLLLHQMSVEELIQNKPKLKQIQDTGLLQNVKRIEV